MVIIMNIIEAIKARHSVRQYTDKKIEGEVKAELLKEIADCNKESGLNIQLVLDEPDAFSGMMAKYGRFRNVRNYIALVGKKGDDFEEECGYYGERIVIKAQMLGLNTCWVAMTYSKNKSKVILNEGEKLLLVISLGYGEIQGVSRKTKSIEELSDTARAENIPDWFISGMEMVQLAPTAINQQKFLFELDGDTVKAKALKGSNSKIDLGIVKYHFEIGSGRKL